MKKLAIALTAIVVILGAALAAVPLLVNSRIDNALEKLQQYVRETQGVDVRVEERTRGLFSREIVLRMSFAKFAQQDLAIPDMLVTIDSGLGPLAMQDDCGSYFGAMLSYTALSFDTDSPEYAQITGGRPLLAGCSETSFSGVETGTLDLQPIDAALEDGTRLRIPAFMADYVVNADGSSTTRYRMPEAAVETPMGSIVFVNLSGESETSELFSSLPERMSSISRLEAIRVSGLQGEGEISDIGLTVTGGMQEGQYGAGMDFTFKSATFAGNSFTDGRYALAFRKLDPEALLAMNALNAKAAAAEDAAAQAALMSEYTAPVQQLMAGSPELVVEELGVKIDGAPVSLKAKLAFDGEGFVSFEESPLLPKLDVDVFVTAPPELVTEAASAMMQDRVRVQLQMQSPDEPVDEFLLEQTAAQQAAGMLGSLEAQGIVVSGDNGNLETRLGLKNGEVLVNGEVNPGITQMLSGFAP